MNRPLVIAHRGSSRRAPENTLKAFELALREGAEGVELDVWRCRTGELVVTHDNELTRLTGTGGCVEKTTFHRLRELDFGQGERIPTLEEALELVKGMELINIEIKGKNLLSRGLEEALFKILRERKLGERSLVSSFNPAILRRLGKLSREIKLGLIFHRGSSLPLRRAWAASFLHLSSLHPETVLLSKALMRRARRKNQKVIAWTVNNIHDLDKCLHLGVHGIITDDPLWALKNLKRG